MVPVILASHTTGTEKIVPLQAVEQADRQAGRQEGRQASRQAGRQAGRKWHTGQFW